MKVGELNAVLKLDGKSQFDRDIDSSGKRFSSLGSMAATAGRTMATTLVATTTAAVGLGAAVFKTGVNYNALQQSSRAALTTLLGSAEAANAQMDKLDDFASNSPFAKDVFIRAQQQLIGFGIAAEDVIPILGAVQDATAAVGGSNQDISDIVTTLSKISSTGKITAQDLNELGNKGIDAASLIGEEFGKSGAEIRNDITNSRISAEDAIDAIVNQMGTKFEGAAANVKQTWDGATDRIKAAWRDIGSELATPFVDPNGGGRAITWANDVADVMRALQKQVAPLMDVVMTRWAGQFDKITPYLQNLKERIDALDMSALNEGLDALDGYGGIIAGLAGAFTAWGTAALPIIGGINPLVAGVTALVLATPELRDGLDRVTTAALPLVSEFGELGVQIADLALKVINDFAPAFIDLAEAVVEAAVPLGGTMADAISGLITIATPFVDLLADVVSWISELPDEVLLAGTAFLLLKDNMSPLTGVVDSVRGAFDNFQLQQHLGRMEGYSTASATASIAMGGFSTAVGRAGTALKTAFMTNAPAIAIAGIVTVISKIANSGKEAEDRIDALANSFDKVTNAATEATDALIVDELMKLDEWDQMVKVAEEAGFSTAMYTEAIKGNAEAQRLVENAMSGVTKEAELTANGYRTSAESGEHLMGKINGLGGEFEIASEKARQHSEAVGNTSGTEDAIDASEKLTEVLGLEAGALQTLIDKRREERGEALTLAETQIKDAEAREAMLAVLEKEGQLLTDNGDAFYAYSEKGQYAINATREVSDSMEKTAQSMALAGAEVSDITAALDDQYDAWIDTAVAMGIPEEKAHELAETYGLIPTDIATDAYLEVNDALVSLEDLKIEINRAEGTVTINGEDAPADATLAELIGNVNEADGTVTINGRDVPAHLTVEALLDWIDNSEEAVTIDGNPRPAYMRNQEVVDTIKNTEEDVTINANPRPAYMKNTEVAQTVRNTEASIKVNANPSGLNNWVSGIAGKILGTSYINIQASGRANLLNHNVQADGSVLDFYAQGGVRENHVAQIAPAGAWRVWAEPETGGEAYIPLALGKRSRSEAILAEVADRFGKIIVDRPSHFADGGFSRAPARPAPLSTANSDGLPRHVVLQIGDREISGLIMEVTGDHPGVRAANEFVSSSARYQKAGY